ncbi:MAG: hypothetical protein H7X99_07095 [Saprospiraceae bacterium]|nr:hypothetical protein [Saprospiraceae bacterium]
MIKKLSFVFLITLLASINSFGQVSDPPVYNGLTQEEIIVIKKLVRIKYSDRNKFHLHADTLISNNQLSAKLRLAVIDSVFSNTLIIGKYVNLDQLILNNFDITIFDEHYVGDPTERTPRYPILSKILYSDALKSFIGMRLMLDEKFLKCGYITNSMDVMEQNKKISFATIFKDYINELESIIKLSCYECQKSNLTLIRTEINSMLNRK